MEYFLSHIGYVVIAALVIAGVAFLWIYLADKNSGGNGVQGGCGMGCAGCGHNSGCTLPEKDVDAIKESIRQG